MEESYEYANEFGKQGRKNPRYIPKITINRELTPTHNLLVPTHVHTCIPMWRAASRITSRLCFYVLVSIQISTNNSESRF